MLRNELDYQEYFYVKQKESGPAKRKGRSESKLIRKRQKGSEPTEKTKQLKPVILKKEPNRRTRKGLDTQENKT